MANDGLSTATFIDGALRGHNYWEGQKDREQMRGLRDAENQRSAKRMQMAEEQHQMAKDRHTTQQEIQGLRLDQIDQEMTQTMNAVLANSLINADELPEDQQALIAAHPNLNANRLLSDEVGQALDTVEKLMQGQISLSSPDVAKAFDVLNPEIGLGSKGGRKVSAKRIYPGRTPGTIMVGLSVDGDADERPLTEGRGSDDSDPVKEVPVDPLLQRSMALKQYREMLMSPEGRDWFVKTYATAAPKTQAGELEKHPQLGWVQKQKDGSYKQYDMPRANGSGAVAPADYRLAKLIQQEYAADGQELSFEQAWTKAKMAVSDPTKYVSDYVKSRLELQEINMPEVRKTPKELEEEAVASYRRIRQLVAGLGTVDGDEGGGDDNPLSTMPSAADYSGRVIRDTETGKRYKSNGTDWVEIK